MNDDEVKTMNRRIGMGWEPTTHQWKVVAERCANVPEMRELRMWGIIKKRKYVPAPRGKSPIVVDAHEVVANSQFFHPNAVVAQNLTRGEAEALIKLMES